MMGKSPEIKEDKLPLELEREFTNLLINVDSFILKI